MAYITTRCPARRELTTRVTILLKTADTLAAVARDLWRQLHIDRALISHYRQRGDPLPNELGM